MLLEEDGETATQLAVMAPRLDARERVMKGTQRAATHQWKDAKFLVSQSCLRRIVLF